MLDLSPRSKASGVRFTLVKPPPQVSVAPPRQTEGELCKASPMAKREEGEICSVLRDSAPYPGRGRWRPRLEVVGDGSPRMQFERY